MMLAQLGAEVIAVDRPGGSSGRWQAPFAGDRVDAESSLWHWAYGRGKRSVVFDPDDSADLDKLHALAAGADIILMSGRPGEMWFDPYQLSERHEQLVVAVLTGFGLDGPKATWNDSDLIVCASACQLAITGDNDLPPLRSAVPQGYLHGAGDLAVGALMALHERNKSGRGQVVDVSAQEAFIQASFSYSLNEAWQAPLLGRAGEGINAGPFVLRWGYPALDGEVSITFLFGSAFMEFTPKLFQWIWEEGGCDEATRDKPWEDYTLMLLSGEEPISELYRLQDIIAEFMSKRTKAELEAEATRRRLLLAPVSQLSEVLDIDHLRQRGFWDHVVQAGGRSYRHPGRPFIASAQPLDELDAPSPLGADTDEVLAEPQRKPSVVTSPARPGRHPASDATSVLNDVKVVDLAWSIAGPLVGRSLADFGASVVRVESRHRVDVSRTVMPLHPRNDDHPLEGSGLYSNTNAGKFAIELDLRVDAAKEVVWDLIDWADVVVESFSAGAFERMGFGYERLKDRNPGIILLSTCLPGQSGTLELPGYGNLSSAMFGFHATTRWPGRPSAGPFGAYTDTVAPRFALSGLLAAIDHQRRTGEGQHLDVSQAEASLHFLAPALLDVEVNGREFEARGNSDLEMSPHGVYPTSGEDRWVAIAVSSDDEWRALAVEMGLGDMADLDTAARLGRSEEIDELVAAWTVPQSREDVEARVQGLGIAAHQVQNSPECLADPQLVYRSHYPEFDHPLLGRVPVEAPRFKLSRTPGRVRWPGPTFGQHTYEILSEVLGYDADQIAEVAAAEAFG